MFELGLKDVRDGRVFSNQEMGKTKAARRVVEGIFEKVQILAEFPEIGWHYRKEPEGDIRVILYGHYRIAYLLRDTDVVEVSGVFHGALDVKRYI